MKLKVLDEIIRVTYNNLKMSRQRRDFHSQEHTYSLGFWKATALVYEDELRDLFTIRHALKGC